MLLSKPSNIESLEPAERGEAFAALQQRAKEIAKEFELEPEQVEANTTPTGSTFIVNFYIKDEEELRKLLTFMRDNDMLAGFE